MEKLIPVIAISFFSATCCAGAMNGDSFRVATNTIFGNIEGSYTWSSVDSLKLNGNEAEAHTKGWGGRLSGGVMHPVSEHLSFSAEAGGGYYGFSHANITKSGYSVRHILTGYDVLLGALYNIYRFDVFGDLGFMIENSATKVTENLGLIIPNGLLAGTTVTTGCHVEIFPEIKVGAIYNVTDHLGVSLAYMHVFGTTVKGDFSATVSDGIMSKNGSAYCQNPTLNSVMLGLRYSVA